MLERGGREGREREEEERGGNQRKKQKERGIERR